MSNKNLNKAKKAKADEFYTQLPDIENELQHYKNQLKDKIIYCNCDDYSKSNFWKYFKDNFQTLGLKKLVASNFVDQTNTLFFQESIPRPVIAEYDGSKVKFLDLKWDGDFRSAECIELLKQADIVVTNPPFSLFREYVDQMMEYDKKFLIIGNQNAITYKEIFALIKEGRMWLGAGFRRNVAHFINSSYEDYATDADHKEGMIRVSGVSWYTNMEHKKRNDELKFDQVYDPVKYPTYDNYDAIDVGFVKDIPENWDGEMGVPITFMHKFNPNQFEIVGLGNGRDSFTPNKDYINPYQISKNGKKTPGTAINRVLAIEVETPPDDKTYYVSDNSKYLTAPFARIIIKKKNEFK